MRTRAQRLNLASAFDDAAALIDARGLAKHRLKAPNGALCVRGAIGAAAGYEPVGAFDWPVTTTAEQQVLGDRYGADPQYPSTSEAVVDWNNAPKRTAADVSRFLRFEAFRLRMWWQEAR